MSFLLKRKILIIIIFGVFFSFLLILQFFLKSSNQKNLILFNEKKEIDFSFCHTSFETPMCIKIPKINIDAVVLSVGITSNGDMAVPKSPAEVAWFDLGTIPGEDGSAVIAGHSGWKDDIPAVFDNLYKLNKGDKIYIKNDKGITITFLVREVKKYNPNEDTEDVFNSIDGKAHLNLITCAGLWDNVSKSSSERLVIFTDKE